MLCKYIYGWIEGWRHGSTSKKYMGKHSQLKAASIEGSSAMSVAMIPVR
jgi:hypothetical protein